jgi:hypothetical protein
MKKLLIFASILSLTASLAFAAIPTKINYQGVLKDSAGNAINNSALSMVFSIYSGATGGTALWTETRSVSVESGIYNVQLGAVTAIPADGTVFDGSTRYLGIKVGTDAEMTPRLPLVSVPYAYAAQIATSAESAAKIGSYSASATGSGSFIPVTSSGKLNSSLMPSSGISADYATNLTGEGNITITGTGPNYIQNGWLGIGTTNPEEPLHIKDSTYANTTLLIETTNDTGFAQMALKGTGREYVLGIGSASAPSGTANKLYLYDNNASAIRMVVNSAGYIGIGTIEPTSRLHVLSTGTGIYAKGETAISAETVSTADYAAAIRGIVVGTTAGSMSAGIYGCNGGTGTTGFGVFGRHNGNGDGVYGEINSSYKNVDWPASGGYFVNTYPDGIALVANNVLYVKPRGTVPGSPIEGMIYYDSSTHKLMVFNGTIWEACN